MLNAFLIAVHKLQFGHFAEKTTLLLLYQAAGVLYELGFTVESHEADHLLAGILDLPAFIDHVVEHGGRIVRFQGDFSQLALKEVAMHQH
jgi:hypothetical protein